MLDGKAEILSVTEHTAVLHACDDAQRPSSGDCTECAEVWRKLLWEYEPGVGVRYGAMLQSSLKRRFGEHGETDLAREFESFERDISKYEQQSSDLISDAMNHAWSCMRRHGAPRIGSTHRSEYHSAVQGTA